MASWSLANEQEKVRAENRSGILKLSIGMTKGEALSIMGIDERRLFGGIGYTQRISNPYKSEILQGDKKTFEVLYYYTDLKKQDGAITNDELTPLIFDEDKLIGWGWSFLNENINRYEIRVR